MTRERQEMEEDMLMYLLSEQTLRQWRPHSLRSRCRLFQRRFPGNSISVHTLRKIYRAYGIRQRVL